RDRTTWAGGGGGGARPLSDGSEGPGYNRTSRIDFVLRKIFGSKHERDIKRLRPRVHAVNLLGGELEGLPDAEVRQRMDRLRARAAEGTEIEELLPETFALVREAGRRRLGMRHFDGQVMAGMVLDAR